MDILGRQAGQETVRRRALTRASIFPAMLVAAFKDLVGTAVTREDVPLSVAIN